MDPSLPPQFGVMMGDRDKPRRLACDRCHSQKLRCIRDAKYNACERCLKSRRECIWSPSLRTGRPSTRLGSLTNERNNKRPRSRSPDGSADNGIRASTGSSPSPSLNPAFPTPPANCDTGELADGKTSSASNISEPAMTGVQNQARNGGDVGLKNRNYPAPGSTTYNDGQGVANSSDTHLHDGSLLLPNTPSDFNCFDFSEHMNYLDIFSAIPELAFIPNPGPLDISTTSQVRSPSLPNVQAQNSGEDVWMVGTTTSNTSCPHGDWRGTPGQPQRDRPLQSSGSQNVTCTTANVEKLPAGGRRAPVEQDAAVEAPLEPMEDFMKQLSTLNTQLYKLHMVINGGFWAKMFLTPSSVTSVISATNKDPSGCGKVNYPIGEIFQNSQKLLDIVTHFLVAEPQAFQHPRETAPASAPSLRREVGQNRASCTAGNQVIDNVHPVPRSINGRNIAHKLSQSTAQTESRGSSFSSRQSSVGSSSSSSPDSTDFGAEDSRSFNTPDTTSTNSHLNTLPQSVSSSRAIPAPLVKLDLPLALLLTTCYVRLLRLYNTLFTHLHHFTLAVSSNSSSSPGFIRGSSDYLSALPPALPGLKFGGFEPPSFGTLQTTLIVQVSCHLLGRIEQILGIEELELSEKRRGEKGASTSRNGCTVRHFPDGSDATIRSGASHLESRGLLLDLMSLELLRSIMDAEGHADTVDGAQGRTAGPCSLQKTIRRVKRLLKKSMSL